MNKFSSLSYCLLLLCLVAGHCQQLELDVTIKKLCNCDHTTDEHAIADYLKTLQNLGSEASPATSTLLDLLPLSAPLYNERGPREVRRLRCFIYVTMAKIGVADGALRFVLEELAHNSNDSLYFAAAARVAAAIGPRAQPAVQYLQQVLDVEFRDDRVALETYNPQWPLQKFTTVREEAIIALGQIGDPGILPQLERFKRALAKQPFSEWEDTHRQVLVAIDRLKDRPKSCCAVEPQQPSARLVTAWTKPSARDPFSLANLRFVDHRGTSCYFRDLLGQPLAIAFFYTRCGNPQKCPSTVYHMGKLQALLNKRGVSTTLLLITYDPWFDTPLRLRQFARQYGIDLTEQQVKILRPTQKGLQKMRKIWKIEMNKGAGWVNHSIELFILDRHGRYVRRYRQVLWDNESVLQDLQRLIEE